jgi:hypothetical protein
MTEPLTKEEFCRRFVDCMIRRAGFEHFDDGMSVREYAEMAAPAYWDEPQQREEGPEDCAAADMDYWGEE